MIVRATENVATTVIGGKHIGQQVPAQDPRVVRAERPRRRDEIALAQRQHLAADDARIGDPAVTREHEDQVSPRSRRAPASIPPPRAPAPETPAATSPRRISTSSSQPRTSRSPVEHDPAHAGEQHGREADEQGHPSAVQEAAGDVAAPGFGAERMLAPPSAA